MIRYWCWGSVVLVAMTAGCQRSESEEAGDHVQADVAAAWNELVLKIAEAEDGLLTLKGVRTAAMVHVAMHDALAAIERRYEPYADSGRAVDADPIMAVNQAAYEVTVAQYPDQESRLAAERARWAGAHALTSDEESAVALGRRTAAAILGRRHGDGWNTDAGYRWHPMAPGVYAEFNEHSGTPEGFVFGAGWAQATPFLVQSADQFRSPPPPDIQSDAYTVAFREVKDVGARNSATRTLDQAHLAMWWKEFVEKSHNRLARELIAKENLDLWDAVRLLALLNMSVFDGYVASFDAKFFYNHWRPYTAIRWASNDGNPDTEEDPGWTNLHDHTYAFPSYPSAHGTVCGAASVVLTDVFGKDYPVVMTIREVDSAGPMSPPMAMDPPTRSFHSFHAAAEECGLSRVYLGIHFRYDSKEGTELGGRVGQWAVEHFLRVVDDR